MIRANPSEGYFFSNRPPMNAKISFIQVNKTDAIAFLGFHDVEKRVGQD